MKRLYVVLIILTALLAGGCSGAAPSPAATAVPTLAALATTAPAPPARPTLEPATASEPISTPTPVEIAAPPGTRGALVPWIEYEAEAAVTDGAVLAPSRNMGEIAAESSGRSAIELRQQGQGVEFEVQQAANSIVVRYVIPDAPQGDGITATLSLYVDGQFRRKLNLTSRYAWSYGGEEQTLNDPSVGGAHHFYDETRALLDEVPAGAKLRLQRDADDTADYYVIDLIDLEQVAPPLGMPPGYLSIAECGAKADDGVDDGPAIQECVTRARDEKRGVWIPPGVWDMPEQVQAPKGIAGADVTIQGAGMWYSVFKGAWARFYCTGSNCRYADFAILGDTITRDDAVPENGFNGGAGTGSRMDRVWVEHTKVGWWVGDGSRNHTDGLVISASRFRNLFADGVNLCNGASHSVVEHSHFRNTGDDALASWAPAGQGEANTGNVMRFNTVQVPWRANCYAIYGGSDITLQDSVCADVVTYPGVLVAQQFKSWPFAGVITVERVTLTRAGGSMWGQQHGALKILASEGDIGGVQVRDVTIESPTFAGIQLQGPQALDGISLARITIDHPGTYGIEIAPDARGAASFEQVAITNAAQGMRIAAPGDAFDIIDGDGNSGW